MNVDTVIQIGTGVVFSAPEEDRDAATGALELLGARWTERKGSARSAS